MLQGLELTHAGKHLCCFVRCASFAVLPLTLEEAEDDAESLEYMEYMVVESEQSGAGAEHLHHFA